MADYDSNPVPDTIQNLIGKTYGRRTVIGYSHAKKLSRGWGHYWLYRCECGNIGTAPSGSIKRYVSCGCFQRERVSTVSQRFGTSHGLSNSVEYAVWDNMKARCYNPKHDMYHNYGGRGIGVCERWRNSFEAFYADMGPRPPRKSTLDRIDNDADYGPDNCRWATWRQQQNNRRNNRLLSFGGETHTLSQWARKTGIPLRTLWWRITKGNWTIERALTEPVNI